mgnify:CR=1 FL=1
MPREMDTPLIVIELLTRDELPMLLNVFRAPLMVLPVSVDGMSAFTRALKLGSAEPPDVGPA